MITRAMDSRDRHDPSHFLDVSYYDLIRDPMPQMERIYAFAERPLTDEIRGCMQATRTKNKQHKYGKHRYALKSFGLDAQELDARFGAYRERFEIPRE
jgi:hypothetical protein